MVKNQKKFKKNWIFFRIGVIVIALYGIFLPGLRAEDYDRNRKIAKLQAEIERLKKEEKKLQKKLKSTVKMQRLLSEM